MSEAVGWDAAVEAAVGGYRRVMVLGPADAGKSTFCAAVLAEAERRGREAVLIDADVGQKSVGPPAAVTAARAGAADRLADLAFVGTTEPIGGLARLLGGIRGIMERMGAELWVVNTSGLVKGVGRGLKAAKLEVVRPDLVVTLGEVPDLEPVLAGGRWRRVRVVPSGLARRKGRGRRRVARQEAFRRYLEGAVVHEPGPDAVAVDPAALPERLLVGLADGAGRDLALGVIVGRDAETGRLAVLAPLVGGEVARVVPGRLLLDEECDTWPLPGEVGR